jgi:hypothetical protein
LLKAHQAKLIKTFHEVASNKLVEKAKLSRKQTNITKIQARVTKLKRQFENEATLDERLTELTNDSA